MNDSGMIMCNSAVLKLFGRLQSGIGRTCRRSISFAGHAIDAHPRLRRFVSTPLRVGCYGML